MFDIKVGEKEFRWLLNRDSVSADVLKAFKPQLELLRDIVNYGTNLVPRCFTSSDKELKDVVLIGILLRQVVSMLDGVEILATNGAVHAAGLQARALFEASVYIEWILAADSDNKAAHYYVHNLRRLRRWARRMVVGTPEEMALSPEIKSLPSLQDPTVAPEPDKTIQNIDRILSQPRFATINQAFDNCSRNGKKERAWYWPLGMKSISAVVNAVGKSSEHFVFYASWSEVTHSSNYGQHVKFGDGKVTFEPIRHLSGFETVVRYSAAIAFRTYRMILLRYRPGEIQVFNNKYLENWRKAFMNIPKIKYEEETTDSI